MTAERVDVTTTDPCVVHTPQMDTELLRCRHGSKKLYATSRCHCRTPTHAHGDNRHRATCSQQGSYVRHSVVECDDVGVGGGVQTDEPRKGPIGEQVQEVGGGLSTLRRTPRDLRKKKSRRGSAQVWGRELEWRGCNNMSVKTGQPLSLA